MVSRTEFLSWAHRAPWAVYLLGPLFASFGTIVLGLLVLTFIVKLMGSGSAHSPTFVPGYFNQLYKAIAGFNVSLLPLLLGWAIAASAVRRRMKPLWPILGLFIVALLCGSQTYYIQWSHAPNGLEGFGVSWPFLPHGGTWTLAAGFRVLNAFCFTAAVYTLWNWHRPYSE
jgi:hypothetical protein